MKNINRNILFVFVIMVSCQSINNNKVQIMLKHEIIDSSNVLVMVVKNNTFTPIYIPELSSIMVNMDSVIFINSKGDIANKQFINNELHDGISFYNPSINTKIPTYYCSDNPNVFDIIDLDIPPFTKEKKMIRSIIQYEYEDLITKDDPKMLIEEDIQFIKSLIFSKYHNSVFLGPKETYYDCITINTLFQPRENYKIFIHYLPDTTISKYRYEFNSGNEVLEITSELLNNYKGFKLYNQPLISDTLIINPY